MEPVQRTGEVPNETRRHFTLSIIVEGISYGPGYVSYVMGYKSLLSVQLVTLVLVPEAMYKIQFTEILLILEKIVF